MYRCVVTAWWIIIVFVMSSLALSGQVNWKEIHSPNSAGKTLVATRNGTLLVFDERSFYRSEDRGMLWRENSAGFPERNGSPVATIVEDSSGTLWAVLTAPDSNVLFRSTSSGASWTATTFTVGGLRGKMSALFCGASGKLFGTFSYSMNGRDTTRVVVGTPESLNFSLLDAPQSIHLMMSRGVLLGRTTEKKPSFTDQYPLWEFNPQTSQWAKIFTPSFDGNGRYPLPEFVALLPTGERFIVASQGSSVSQNIYSSADNGSTWTLLDRIPRSAHAIIPMSDTSIAIVVDFHSDNSIDTQLVKRDGKWVLAPLTRLRNRGVIAGGCIDGSGTIYVVSNDGENASSRVLRLPPDRTRWQICGLSTRDALAEVFTDTRNRIFMRYRNGMIYRSDDEGVSWRTLDENLPQRPEEIGTASRLIVADDDVLYVLADTTILTSTDAGSTWKIIDVNGTHAVKLHHDRTRVFVIGESIVELSGGKVTQRIQHPYSDDPEAVTSVTKLNNGVYVLHNEALNSYLLSATAGQSWTEALIPAITPQDARISQPLEMQDGTLYAGIISNFPLNMKTLLQSTDSGVTWTAREFTRIFRTSTHSLMTNRAGIPYFIDDVDGVVRCTPYFDGTTTYPFKNTILRGMCFNGANELYTYDYAVLYKAVPIPGSDNWERTGAFTVGSNDKKIISITSKSTNEVWIGSTKAGVLRTINNGGAWSGRDMMQTTLIFKLMADSRNDVYSCTNYGVYRQDAGAGWIEKNTGLPVPIIIYDLLEDRAGNLYAATFGDGVYRSTNRGDEWVKFSAGLRNTFTRGLTLDADGTLYAATNGGIYKLVNGESEWQEISGNLGALISGGAIEAVLGSVYCYTDKRLQRFDFDSQAWSAEMPDTTINALYTAQNGWLIACTNDGLRKKTSSSSPWEHFGLAGKDVWSIGENATYFFAGVGDGNVYRISKGFTSVESEESDEMVIFPNPAGDFAALRSTVPIDELIVYSSLGIELLRSTHPTILDVRPLPPGMYYCSIRTGSLRRLYPLSIVR
ncbi:MAG: hypothetical protein U0264_13395 [Candidatus Kapaibacterium sp.]